MTEPRHPAAVTSERGRAERRAADHAARTATNTPPSVPAPTPDGQTDAQGREDVDIYELRERGVRVLGEEQCCELGCDGGACESCPCCCAGWCVSGHSGEIPDRDLAPGSDYRIWLAEAAEHNPVAKALAERDRLVGVDFDDEVPR